MSVSNPLYDPAEARKAEPRPGNEGAADLGQQLITFNGAGEGDTHQDLGWALINLMHYADSKQVQFDTALQSSEKSYKENIAKHGAVETLPEPGFYPVNPPHGNAVARVSMVINSNDTTRLWQLLEALRHWADRHQVDFEEMVYSAELGYEAEDKEA